MPKIRNYSQKRQKKYSRAGCSECKKAHLKCDEQTPVCGRCLKRHTSCNFSTVENKELNFPGMHVMNLEEGDSQTNNENRLHTDLPIDEVINNISERGFIKTRFPIITSTGSAARTSSANASASSSGKIDFNTLNNDIRSSILNSVSITPPKTTITTPPSLSISDLVFIQPHEVELIYSQKNIRNFSVAQAIDPNCTPKRDIFILSWKYTDVIDFVPIFNKHDPLIPLNNSHFPSDVSLNEPIFLDFVWTLASQTKFFFVLTLFPDETHDELLDSLLTLARVYPIVQSIMTYECSMLMIQIYNANNLSERSGFWDEQVRLTSFKQCLNILSDRIEKSISFEEYSVMSFTVLILFCANCSDESWRTHFQGCHQLLRKARKLYPSTNIPQGVLGSAASKLFGLTVCWFHNAQVLATFSTDKGCDTNSESILSTLSTQSSALSLIPDNGITLMFGYSCKVVPILDKLCNRLNYFKNKVGLNLCGSNLLTYHLMKQKYNEIAHHVSEFGIEISRELASINDDYQRTDFNDFRRNVTLRNIEKLERLGLELYINYFFVGKQSVKNTTNKILEILELFISTPYHSTAGSVIHWVLYISAVTSLLLGQNNIYNEFLDCFVTSNKNGIYSVEKTLTKLNHIRNCLINNTYEDIVDSRFDSIMI